MVKKLRVIIVMPAYNAAKTIEKTYKRIPQDCYDDILVVDDASKDETVKKAKELQLKFFVHDHNLGYGGNQKTCYKQALALKGDIVVMLHPDYQYDPKFIPYLVKPLINNDFDIMLGSRIRNRAETLKSGMPVYKYFSNRFLTFMENIVMGLNLSEYHTGFRAFKKEVLETLPLEKYSNDFIFDQEIIIGTHVANYRIGEIYAPSKYTKESSSINFKRSAEYGLAILYNLGRYLFHKQWFVKK